MFGGVFRVHGSCKMPHDKLMRIEIAITDVFSTGSNKYIFLWPLDVTANISVESPGLKVQKHPDLELEDVLPDTKLSDSSNQSCLATSYYIVLLDFKKSNEGELLDSFTNARSCVILSVCSFNTWTAY